MPSTVTWINPNGGDWDTGSNWSTGAAPGAGDDVAINSLNAGATVTHASAASDSVSSVTSLAPIILSGGSLSVADFSTFDNALTISQATLTGTGVVMVNGPFTWAGVISNTGGLTVNGNTDVVPSGGTVGATLDGTTLTNYGTATFTSVQLLDGATFVNAAGASLVATQASYFGDGGAAWDASLDNRGTVRLLGSGTTTFQLNVTDEAGGLIEADGGGTLVLGGAGQTISTYLGTVRQQPGGPGAGVEFDGSSTFAPTSSIDFDHVTFFDGSGTPDVVAGSYSANLSTTVNVNDVHFTGAVSSVGALDVEPIGTANFSTASGGPLNLALPSLRIYQGTLMGSDGIAVNGPFTWAGVISNTGGLTVNGNTDVVPSGGTVGAALDGTTLTNYGAATCTGAAVLLLDNATFVNAAGASLVATGGGDFGYTGPQANLVNAGTIETLANTATRFSDNVTNEAGALIQAGSGSTLTLGAHTNNTYDGTIQQQPGGPGASVDFDGYSTFAPTSSIDFDCVTFFNGANVVAGSYSANLSTTISVNTVQFTGAVPSVGTLDVEPIGTADFSLAGSGQASATSVNLASATLASTGPLQLQDAGAYTQSSDSTLALQLGPLTAGADYDEISTGGAVALAGTLSLSLANGFTPQPGEVFTLFHNQQLPKGNFTGLPAGQMFSISGYQFQISYVGGSGHDVTLTVPGIATTTAVTASANSPLLNQAVSFTATVTPAVGSGTPTGTVQFQVDGVNAGAPVPLSGGSASYSTATLSVGAHTITAVYSGDTAFLSSSGSTALTVIPPASLSGIVWEDFNDDGQVDFGENGISGVKVTLTGTDDLGNAVSLSQTTDGDGAYVFLNLRPGNYYLTETQPAGYGQGIDSIGTAGGTLSATDQFSVSLAAGVNGLNYNFGEQPPAGGGVHHGQTATIGFWNNKNGQALIKALNGGSSSTQLANWLAATLPHTFGKNAGANNLLNYQNSGQVATNAQVAALFQQDFVMKGVKLDAQVLATALSVYATNATLDPTKVAASYGFTVSGDGAGTATANVGSNGDAFGVANNTTLTLMDLLLAADAQAVNGVLYGGNTTRRNEANTVFSAINQDGGIS